jgi:hypothetical protein
MKSLTKGYGREKRLGYTALEYEILSDIANSDSC